MSINWGLKTTWDTFTGIKTLSHSPVGMVGGNSQAVAVLDLETGRYGSSYEAGENQLLHRVANTVNNIFCLTGWNTCTLHKLDPQTFNPVGSYEVEGLIDFAVDDGRLYTLLCTNESTTVQELNPSTLEYMTTVQMAAGTFGRIVSKNGKVAAYSTDGKDTNLGVFTKDLSGPFTKTVIQNDIPNFFQADPQGWLYSSFRTAPGLYSYCLSPFQQQGAWTNIPMNRYPDSSSLHFLGDEIFLSSYASCSVYQNDVQLSLKGTLPNSTTTLAFGSMQDNQLLCATPNSLQIYSKGDHA